MSADVRSARPQVVQPLVVGQAVVIDEHQPLAVGQASSMTVLRATERLASRVPVAQSAVPLGCHSRTTGAAPPAGVVVHHYEPDVQVRERSGRQLHQL
jgi:hypothetical protein